MQQSSVGNGGKVLNEGGRRGGAQECDLVNELINLYWSNAYAPIGAH